MRIAYALFAALGLLGAHRFYLGRVRSATVQMMLSFAAAAAAVVLAGDPSTLLLAAVPVVAGGWWLMDLFRTAGMVRERNGLEATRSDAPGYDRGWPHA
ncbi:NINE protein [Agrococcus sp. Ld7]|uniref:NINE protein n=1 Tax=Agrococcus sp. Ld7 TaxID=649148 RepID=UPI003869D141